MRKVTDFMVLKCSNALMTWMATNMESGARCDLSADVSWIDHFTSLIFHDENVKNDVCIA